MSDREAAKAMREAAAGIARSFAEKNVASRDDCLAADNPYGALTRARQAQTATEIESAIRDLPLPEPIPDLRAEALAKARKALDCVIPFIAMSDTLVIMVGEAMVVIDAVLNPGDAKPKSKGYSEEWCLKMAAFEGDQEISAGIKHPDLVDNLVDAKPDPRKSEAEIRAAIQRLRREHERFAESDMLIGQIQALEWVLNEPKQQEERAK